MSRRDDRDRSRTRRRRDRSPTPPRKARRRESDTTMVSDGMDWSNPMMWQYNPNINPPSSMPQSQTTYNLLPHRWRSSIIQRRASTSARWLTTQRRSLRSPNPPRRQWCYLTTHKDVTRNLRQQRATRLRYQCSLRSRGSSHPRSGNPVRACWTRIPYTPSRYP